MAVGTPSFDVLLIYQGTNSAQPIQFIHRHLQSIPNVQVKVHEVGNKLRTLKDLVGERVREDIERCDAAIAVATLDERPASVAGNMWFEIGIWLGARSSDTLMLCVQRNARRSWWSGWLGFLRSQRWDVEVPSDLGGHAAHDFTEPKDLADPITKFVTSVRDASQGTAGKPPADDEADERVRDTLIRHFKHPIRKPLGFYLCPKDQEICPFRKESSYFISELLRMGHANREHAIIEACLSQIALYADAILDSFYQNEPSQTGTAGDNRGELGEKLLDILERLHANARDLLRRRDTFSSPHDDPWRRLKEYLSYRLEVAGKYPTRDELPKRIKRLLRRVSSGSKASDVDRFIKWARDVLDRQHNYLDIDFTPQERTNLDVQELGLQRNFARRTAEILEFFGDEYFSSCHKAICSGLDTAKDAERFHSAVGEIRGRLPHNKNGDPLPLVWPREKREP